MPQQPFVISIASVSGGGKTTITEYLQEKLSSSCALYFDDYSFEGEPENILVWVNSGADYNQWDLSPLVEDVEKFKGGGRFEYIILDYPFAYMNNQMRELIDFAIYIDTPLDIAMARRINRDFHSSNSDDIISDLSFYLEKGREAYLEMEKIKSSSDYIIDGSLSTFAISEEVLEEINAHKRRRSKHAKNQ
ncbi:hypothetical protein CEY16_13630 [Halalkalibacillus sediminis]|uniref:Phosphoribulokinase/uridine kinase domain-containing protein n=1 Tax=Halalkalibacillus sediminis TaxID=2018042 RepID=A0A2I0QRZ6_9BACI|nr:hypothetical protein [Halalkalibacillus sediminis]PKR76850.1 hypothetical protein CEY16_13630 [Halalkalibacillus sediminis]